MKGLQGMIVAAGLGIIGAICNWFYISQQASDYEKIQFLAVKSQTQIAIGDVFKAEHFMSISIPKLHVGNLDKVAVKYDAKSAVIGDKAKKTYTGDELIMQEDLRTTGFKQPIEQLADNEVGIQISVDASSFVASRVNPGDKIGFYVKPLTKLKPAKNETSSEADNNSPQEYELLGPYDLLMIGDRTGSNEIYKATQGNSKNENILTFRGKQKDKKLDADTEKLMKLKNGEYGIQQIILYPKKTKS